MGFVQDKEKRKKKKNAVGENSRWMVLVDAVVPMLPVSHLQNL